MTCRIVLKSLARWAAACTLAFALASPAFAADKITVFAAASLKNALDAVGAAWTADTGMDVAVSYAASSALAKQIQEGAPADVFISADVDWMNSLATEKHIADGSIVKLLGNDLVLIAPKESSLAVTLADGAALSAALGDGKLAMGDVKAVPAGKYGKAALEQLGLWPSVEGKVAMAENVRAALKLVATGEAPLGIVYKTDAMAEPAVKVVATFPAASHPAIVYPVGRVATSENASAADFISYLQGVKAQSIFKAQGFTVLVPPAK